MKKICTYLLAAVAAISACNLIGWVFDLKFFIHPVWGNIELNPTAALCLLMTAAGFLLSLWRSSLPIRTATFILALSVTAISGVKLLALFGIDIRIDQFLFQQQILSEISHGFINRMAPNAALNFLIVSIILVLSMLPLRRAGRINNVAALIVFFISLFSFIGHLYHVKEHFGILNYRPIALEATICFMLLSLAILTQYRGEGFMREISSANTGGTIMRRLIPGVILVPATLGFIRLYIWWHIDFSVELGVAALITSIIIVFLGLLWYFGTELNRSDEARKYGEVLLKRQAELLRMMPGGVAYATPDKIVRELNDTAIQMFDLQNEQVTGHNIEDFLIFDPIGTTNEARLAQLYIQGFWVGEMNITNKKTLKKLTVVVHIQKVENIGNNISGYMLVYTDITERKITEERMALAIEGTAGALWDWDIANSTNWWSPRYFEMLGYAQDEITPSHERFKQLLHPDDQPLLSAAMSKHFRERKKRFSIEARFHTKSGVYKWFQVYARIKYDDHSTPCRMTGSIVNIDDRKRAQETIQIQADLFKMMPDATLYGTRDLSITDMNSAAEQLFEVRREDAIGRKIDDIITIEVVGMSRNDARLDLWGNKGLWRGESILTTQSGNKIRSIISLKAIHDDKGTPVGWLGIYTNITVLQINEELKVALARQEDNIQYLEQLAYISMHDLKAPIITANSLLDMIVKGDGVKEPYTEMLGMIKGTMEQMKRTNAALYDILKIRKDLVEKKDSSSAEVATLGLIINDVKTTLQKNMDEKDGALNIDLGPFSDTRFPYLHIRSVLYNLLSNAIKYSDPARKLTIQVEAKNLSDGSIRISITDNGMGINLDYHRAKLFGVFKRFHTHVEGTGVGLHIVKSIIDTYGGEIDVKSAVGVGTSFDIYFSHSILAIWN